MNIKASWALLAVAAAAALNTIAPGDASAALAVARKRATEYASKLEDRGFVCRNEIHLKELEPGESMVISTTLYGGNEYVIVGAGDEGMSDIDVELYDRDGNLLANDNQADSMTAVDVKVKGNAARAYLKVVAFRGAGWATATICYRKY